MGYESLEGRAEELFARVEDGSLSFAPGELSPFLFPDVAGFLRDKENTVTVITFGNKAFQKAKTDSAFHGIPRVSVMLTGDVRKGAFLAPHTHLHRDALLVDDAALELEGVTTLCPDIKPFQMSRYGGEGDGHWPVIRSLSELP